MQITGTYHMAVVLCRCLGISSWSCQTLAWFLQSISCTLSGFFTIRQTQLFFISQVQMCFDSLNCALSSPVVLWVALLKWTFSDSHIPIMSSSHTVITKLNEYISESYNITNVHSFTYKHAFVMYYCFCSKVCSYFAFQASRWWSSLNTWRMDHWTLSSR